MSFLLDVALCLLGLPVVLAAGYLLFLTLLSFAPAPRARRTPTTRFRIVVPAHDESAGIVGTVENLRSIAYPKELFDVLVVADNCTDDTADRARGAGAQVMERTDDVQRGKGYALHYAFERLPEAVDAAVVIDADTVVSPNLLAAFDSRLADGAHAVQADYAVRNANGSWRTRLMAIAFGAFHVVRSRGRERLGVSAGLRGNGMCFTTRVLKDVPHEAYSIVEDVEYGIRLAEAGHRVFYADEAHVYGEMVSTSKAARSQRERWEGGRALLTQRHGARLLRKGLAGNRVLLDLAADILVPPLSRIATFAMLGAFLSLVGWRLTGSFLLSRVMFFACVASIATYVLRGWALSGTGARGLLDLALAPGYVIWKASLARLPANREWVRTTRESADANDPSAADQSSSTGAETVTAKKTTH